MTIYPSGINIAMIPRRIIPPPIPRTAEIDDVINIVNLARSARSKANIKIRQPLSTIYIYSDAKKTDSIKKNEIQIKDELNIKSIKIISDVNQILDYKVKPNFSLLSSKYGSDMKKIISSINSSNQNKLVAALNENGVLDIDIDGKKIQILREEILIDIIGKNNLCVNSNSQFTIALDIKIDKELKMEGIVRDLIWHVQNFRKDSNLEVNDRIIFSINSSKEILESISKFENYLKNETLISVIKNDLDEMDFKTNFKIDDYSIEIGISKLD